MPRAEDDSNGDGRVDRCTERRRNRAGVVVDHVEVRGALVAVEYVPKLPERATDPLARRHGMNRRELRLRVRVAGREQRHVVSCVDDLVGTIVAAWERVQTQERCELVTGDRIVVQPRFTGALLVDEGSAFLELMPLADFPGPGEVYDGKFSEAAARGFYRRWLDLMLAE